MQNNEKRLMLPKLISHGCVLQTGEKTRIWGLGTPGEGVTLRLLNQEISCRADGDGNWEAYFNHLQPGGPFTMELFSESGETIRVTDVYLGEVFICSGQSNMELPMNRVKDQYPMEFEKQGDAKFRLYKVKENYEFQAPLKDHLEASWKECSPETIGEFSAVSYFFGKFMREDRNVPIGLINVSLGGSTAEAWMGEEEASMYPDMKEELAQCRNHMHFEKKMAGQIQAHEKWYEKIRDLEKGMDWNSDKWKEVTLPAFLKDFGLNDFNGVIWFKKRVMLPEHLEGKKAKLWLGTMVDSDRTYVNGVLVGETGYQYPPRKYNIPEGVLKAGENEIYISLVCEHGAGRVTPGKIYALFAEEEVIALDGRWEYLNSMRCEPAPNVDLMSQKPAGLYNGMLAPCFPYMVRGVLWYQGESNDERPDSYEERLQHMILLWRKKWKSDSLPFVIAQLPGFSIDLDDKGDAWPRIRQAQRKAAGLKNVAVTVNLDVGEENDLHPLNKREVAYRMFLAVKGMIFGEHVIYRGPWLSDFDVSGEWITLTFETEDKKGLVVHEGTGVEQFEIAGPDGICHPATGKINDNQVLIHSNMVKQPVFFRYCWSNAPKTGLLYNEAGLPASPFEISLHSYRKSRTGQ
ncbi:sialate O-acetylesterase [Lacrimispora sp. 38-1]|uniref:sialate O-acetylesterase n=1 Tax=Lacrimispora sp. 38-1 TaxID=3125778 RepID=UPI003CFA2AD2